MCGIAGVLYKNKIGPVGKDLVNLVYGIRHRGEDSCGVALFTGAKASDERHWLLEVRLEAGRERAGLLETVARVLNERSGRLLNCTQRGTILILEIEYGASVADLCYALDRVQVQTVSIGKKLHLYKDLGTGDVLDRDYGFSEIEGTHGIGHTRLATESRVSPDRSHPFWAYGFTDVAIVHNGQLTNYYKLKRYFQRLGYQFRTDNDSELIAIYCAHYLKEGFSLFEILERSVTELDGTYTFLVATPDQLGFAKDKLAAKPLVYIDLEDRVVLASEEVALRTVITDMSVDVEEPPPFTVGCWLVTGEKQYRKIFYKAVGLE
ncbi:MAG: amidophosphoribosyltransferase [Desulfotomaculales bacterium]